MLFKLLNICMVIVAIEAVSVPKQTWSKFELDTLQAHNRYRSLHDVESLSLNKTLCKHAQEWADHLASKDILKHRPNNPYGENLYGTTGTLTGSDSVEGWYDEIHDYNFTKPGYRKGTGHFTQLIWKASKEIGVGVAESKSGWTYVVVNYKPRGNVYGHYKNNVPPPKN